MRKLAALVLCIGAAATLVLAQNAAPTAQQVASISVGDGGLLTYVSGGEYLVAADGAQLQLYDVSDPASPQDVATIALDGVPTALAATGEFALAALDSGSSMDVLLAVAPDEYSRGDFGVVNVLDIPANPRGIALSPNNRWALIAGDGGYMTMALSAADAIESSALIETGDLPITDVALTNDLAFLVRGQQIDVLDLTTSSQIQRPSAQLALDAEGTAISINDAGTLGAVALADSQLILFNPNDLRSVQTIALEDSPVRDAQFIQRGERQYLALMIENRPAVMLIDVTDPDTVSLPGSVGVGRGSVRSLTAHESFIAVSSGSAVLIFQIED